MLRSEERKDNPNTAEMLQTQTCASMSQRYCMASAPGSTNSLSFSLYYVTWMKMNYSPVPDRIYR